MTFRVEVSSEAERDLDAILEWLISNYAGETGIRWFEALGTAITSLSEFPRRCPLASGTLAFPFELRQLLFGQKPHIYRILFA